MRITEPVNVTNIFAEKLGRVDVLDGGFVRFLLCVTRFDDNGVAELRGTAVVTMPLSNVPDAVLMTTKATALGLVGAAEPAFN